MKNNHGWYRLLLLIVIALGNQSFAKSHIELVESQKSKVERDLSFVEMTKRNAVSITTTYYALQQQNLITGTVTFDGMPMTGVTISIKGKSTTTVSGEGGNYSIAAEPTDVLIFTYVGFKTLEIAVNGKGQINAVLQEDMTSLQEVTVNAGYYNVKDSERTGSIAKITAKDIEKQPVTNVLAAMQGRMAGVAITQDSGIPGGGFNIRIRGQNSLRFDGNEPLYVIDGVPFSADDVGFGLTASITQGTTSPLNSINPTDVESIEVLKDADATAIYGSRGANGVVLITTKKGKAGKTRVTVDASTGFGKVTKFVDLMNTEEYLEVRRQAFANDGFTEYPATAYDVNGTWDQNRYTDWQKELLGGTASINTMMASVSGGSASTQYLLSGNFRSETTVMPGDFYYNKGSVHFSMNHLSDDQKFRLQLSAGYTNQKNNQSAFDPSALALTLAPNAPALYDDAGNLNWENSTWVNPLANLRQRFIGITNTLVVNTVLSYELAPGLQAKSNFGFTDLKNDEKKTTPYTIFDPVYGVGSEYSTLHLNMTNRQSWIVEPQLNYSKTIGRGRIEALLGSTFQNQISDRLQEFGRGFSSDGLIGDLASATTRFVYASDETVYRYQAFFARVNFNWKERYIVNATGRRDGSSRFGPGRQFANFGAVGAAWLFSNETLLKDNSVLSFGKLRGSFGTTGNDQIGDYQFLDTYASSGSSYQNIIGLQPTRLFNPNFGWETNKKLEVALETGFFKDRVFLTAAWYRNRSSNQLVGIPLPGTTGFTTFNSNFDASVENSGFEFTLRTVNIKSENFNWTTHLNLSMNRNKLLSYRDLETSPFAQTYVVGESLNIQKLYHFTGLNSATGLYEYEDVNGDGILSSIDDRQTIVDFTPDYFGGLQNQFTYKQLQLDFLFQFVKQNKLDFRTVVPGVAQNQTPDVLDYWQQPGDTAQHQQLTTGLNSDVVNAYYKFGESDGAVVDGSYIRLKNISLTYDVPLATKSLRCRLYLQGQNLLTFTNFKGGDPESRLNGYLPPLKFYTAGVQLTF